MRVHTKIITNCRECDYCLESRDPFNPIGVYSEVRKDCACLHDHAPKDYPKDNKIPNQIPEDCPLQTVNLELSVTPIRNT